MVKPLLKATLFLKLYLSLKKILFKSWLLKNTPCYCQSTISENLIVLASG